MRLRVDLDRVESRSAIPGFFHCRARSYAGLLVFLLVAITLTVRVPFLFWPLTGDEGNYAYTAYWWAHGQTLYADFLGLEKPQGVFLSYWLAQALLGYEPWAIRLWGAIWAAGTTIAVLFTAMQFGTRKVATCAALLFALYSCLPPVEGFTANAETFLVLPLTLSALMLWKDRPGWCGFLVAIALLYKLSAFGGCVLAICWFIYRSAPLRLFLRFVLGAILPLAAALAHGVITVGLGTYLYSFGLFRMQVGWQYIPSPATSFVTGWLQTASVWLPLALLAAFGFRRLGGPQRTFLLLWIFGSLLGTAMGGDWNLHYFIQLIPPLTIPAAAGLFDLVQCGTRSTRVLTMGMVALSLIWIAPWFLKPPMVGSWELYRRTGIQIGDEVGAYIQSHTNENDRIYVAFYQANIYYQAHRRAVVPFLSRVQLLFVPDAYDRLIRTIENRQPVYVLVLGQVLDGYDGGQRFQAALEARYRIEKRFGETRLYRRIEEEPPTDADR